MNAPILGENRGRTSLYKKYFALSSGTLSNEVPTRYFALILQFCMLGISCISAFMYTWWFNTSSSFFYALSWIIVPLSWVGYFYWTIGFYLSVRSQVPKFVSTKHVTGLFGFTLVFAEALVLSLLMWLLYIILSFTGTNVCSLNSYACRGFLRGLFVYLNTLLVLLGVVLWSVRRQLGIELWDAFGLK